MTTTSDNTAQKKPISFIEAAKLVKRTVPALDGKGKPTFDKDGAAITKQVAISEADVLNAAEYDDCVVVVTREGEKLVHNKAAQKAAGK